MQDRNGSFGYSRFGLNMRVGKIISIEQGPQRDVAVRITSDRLVSEISVPPGDIRGVDVSAIHVTEEQSEDMQVFRLYLETIRGERILFYTAVTKFDIALLLDELEASLGNKPRTWNKAGDSNDSLGRIGGRLE